MKALALLLLLAGAVLGLWPVVTGADFGGLWAVGVVLVGASMVCAYRADVAVCS